MEIQRSFIGEKDKGVLYLVGTPIGNLSDITYRALQILQEVDVIAAEDTRHTLKLLNHFNVNKKLVSYHEHNKISSGYKLIEDLENAKKIALVSDAGMPAISDPGYEIVVEAIKRGISVVPIPGANAAIASLVASGLGTKRFVFLGFLAKDKKTFIKELTEVKQYSGSIIIYEAPHRIKKTLKSIKDVLGNREISLSRELTKKHEEFIRGNIDELIAYLDNNQLKGEMTLVIEGTKVIELESCENDWWQALTINEHVDFYVEKNKTIKEAIKMVALERNTPKREIYHNYHIK